MSIPDLEPVAFVVIGRNEGSRLRDCLASVLNVSRKVVYADSGSTDGSTDLARTVGVQVVELDAAIPMNAARGRNAGLEVVRKIFPECRYVQFLDGDCLLQPGWIHSGLTFLEERYQAAAACGRRFEAHPEASLYNRLADEEWNTPVGKCGSCGGDALMRIAALDEVGPFDGSLMASEEPELAARLRHAGWEIWRLDEPMTEHDARIYTFTQWWRRTTRSGYGYAQAWLATQSLGECVNDRLLKSALSWVVIIPASIVAFSIYANSPLILMLLPLLYAGQIFRMSLRARDMGGYRLKANAMLMLAKVPELIGAARYLISGKRHLVTIEYKSLVSKPSSANEQS